MADHPTRTLPTHHSTAGPPTGDSTGLAPDPPASPAVAPDPPPGYEFVGEIGHGGMGVVYQARDLSLDRDVAVKLLQDRYPAGSFAARRFLDEARITGQLQHPGIPAVHQVGALPNGRPFLAMKLIKGRTLDELLAERADPSADRGRFLAVFEQVCQAVGYAHAHHVIHRDLKPANVMVGAFAEVQVMDWGLAKVLTSRGVQPPDPDPDEMTLGTEIRSTRGEDAATQAGSLLGTPAYMAPEQAIGAVDRIDERTDVFGLGGVLCAVLTGRPPYVGDTAESTRQLAARAKLDDAHARLAACGAEPELVVLCRRCLSPEPADRPRDAGEVASAVHRLRSDAEGRARQAELDRAKAEVQAAEQHKQRRAQLAFGGMVVLVLLAGGGLAGWQWRQAEKARGDTQDALTEVKEEQGRTLAALDEQKKQTALADGRLVALNRETANLYLAQGQSLCEQGESARGLHWLARGYQHAESAGLQDVRDTAWEMLSGWTRDVHPLKAVISAAIVRAALSPDGTRVLTGSMGGMVAVWDAATGQRVGRPWSHGADVTAVAFSADGRKAVTGGTDGFARMWDVATGRAIGSPMRHGAEVQGAAFSPDGRKLITGGKDNRARLWDAATGEPLNVVLVHQHWVPAVAFSPDGSKVLTGSWDHMAQLWDAETGERVGQPLVLPRGLIHAIAFSPDGKRFLTGTLRGEVATWETDTHRLAGPVLQHAAAIHALAFSPDGRLVLTGSRDGTGRVWDAVTGKPVGPTLRHRSTVTGVGFAPDGRTMLTAGVGTGVFVWEITAPPPATHLRRAATVATLGMSRDGRHVVAGGIDTTATLWDATTGQTLGEPLRLGGRACAVAFGPDGRTVAVGDDGGSVRLYSVPDAKPTGVAIKTGSATSLAFSPDGSTVLTCGTTDKEVRFWDPSSGRRVGTSLRHSGPVRAAVFSPDGSKVATSGSDRSVRIWDARTGDPIGGPLLPQGRVLSLAFSPDGSRLLAGGDMWGSLARPAALLWDVSTGRQIGPPLIHPSSVADLTFHPDGRLVLTGCEDGAGRLWDTATGQPVGPPLHHSAPVHAVRFSPDGRIAVTGSHDNSVRLWDAHTGRPAGPALTYVAPVKWLLFDPDGRRLLAGSVTSQTATVWHLPIRTPPRPADEVTARVQAITGAEMDANGTFHVLGVADWMRRRAQVAAAQAGAAETGRRDQANPDPATAAPPTTAGAYHSLGLALHKKGSVDQAIEAYRKAIQLDPAYAPAYSSLGAALRAKRDSDGEIAAYREAVRHEVNSHPIYTRLAILLVERSEPREALGVLQRGGRVNPGWLADPTTFVRYNSACCACLTAAGSGKNVPTADERSSLRKQALDWLTADLAAWRKFLAANPARNRAAVHRTMAHWLIDADLASVRERAALEKVPLDERVGWVKLWTEVRELRDDTAPPEVAPPPRLVGAQK